MNRKEAEKLLCGGEEGIKKWNRRRAEGEDIPSLEGIDLHAADLRGAELSETYFGEANLSGADLSGANLSGANLRAADLRKADLRGAELSETYFGEANLSEANLSGANLRGADLSRADLSRADLRGADLRGANLRGADLRKADLSGADLRMADLRGADLRMADLFGADLRGAMLDKEQSDYLRRFGNYSDQPLKNMDVEAELKMERERVKKLQTRLKAQLDNSGNTVNPEEHKKLEKKLEQSEARAKRLEEENSSFKAEQEITGEKIERSIKSLESPNKYIFWEKLLHNFLFVVFLGAAFWCLWYLYSSILNYVDNEQVDQVTGFEMIKFFAPRILAISLFGVFLTQVNRRRRSIQELQERKRAVETLRGVFLAINILSDTTSLARQRINNILDKLAEQALELGKDGPNRPTKADHESDHVEILKELKDIQKDISILGGKRQ